MVLLLVSIAIGAVWCVVLPWLANRPNMRQQLNLLDEQGIDPSAMFYTELDAMDGILQRSGVR